MARIKSASAEIIRKKADRAEARAKGEEIAELPSVLNPGEAQPGPGGRPTAYKPEFVGQVEKLCAMGATDAEMAEFFGVSTVTYYAWQKKHPEFLNAIQLSKDAHDNRVERSLYQKAVGYERMVQKATASGQVVDLKEYFPPDTGSAIFWLKNRRSQKWRDRQENVNLNVTIAGEFEGLMRQIHRGEPIQLESDSTVSQEITGRDFSSDAE